MSEQTYRIKPLEWRENRAYCALGVYRVDRFAERFAWFLNPGSDGYHDGRGSYTGNEEEAKRGAEAHYRERLLTALDPA